MLPKNPREIKKKKSAFHKKAEKKVAKQFNGWLTPRSGAFIGLKGDISTDKYLIEVKSTVKKTYLLNFNVLEKIYQEALLVNKIPLLVVVFNKFKEDYVFYPFHEIQVEKAYVQSYEVGKTMLLSPRIFKNVFDREGIFLIRFNVETEIDNVWVLDKKGVRDGMV